MSLRIGCDLDGVLADMDAAIAEAVERLFGPAAVASAAQAQAAPGAPATTPADEANENGVVGQAPEDVPEDEAAVPAARLLTGRQQRRLWQEIRDTENFWESLNEIEAGAIARLATLAQERRWEVIFITQRPSSVGDTCQVQSQRWLQRLGFPCPSVFVIRGSRGKVASALDLDVVIDDRPENCLDVVVDSKARSVLIWRGDPQSPVVANAGRLGIDVMASMQACLETLVESDGEIEKPGLLGRIKKLMGSR
jgi:hypothetical protein